MKKDNKLLDKPIENKTVVTNYIGCNLKGPLYCIRGDVIKINYHIETIIPTDKDFIGMYILLLIDIICMKVIMKIILIVYGVMVIMMVK